MTKNKIIDTKVMGYNLMTDDGYMILGLDYDNMFLDFIISEMTRIQKDYSLGDIHIIKTNNHHYHAVCFDKLDFYNFKKILRNSHADEKYTSKMVYFNTPKVLRITSKGEEKLTLVHTIKGKNENMNSTAHKLLYDLHGIIPFQKTRFEDNLKKIRVVFYTTKTQVKINKLKGRVKKDG